MATRELHGVKIECVQGNIEGQPDMEAIVNAANAELRIGGGVAGAIHRAAGPGLEAECRPLAPIRPGEAVITGAHHLPNRYVIHCLGPVYGMDKPSDRLLASCYRNALQLSEDNGIGSIAFPAISTGVFGYPLEPAARVALGTIFEMLPMLSTVHHIRIVLFNSADIQVYEQVLNEFSGK
ncbi:macro domain-containing protein [Desulfatitalea alkaliphila]|uniref:Macro domain-containing protein n=1 Tax=Desulfatitalea alkaliphila TaxID=2929485 RepID=A0AA41R531_9BACT|nr:macro domain-containing protein [Desulfatitalea alkaliphila]MCJ8501648.1 macro domain-containing protein [Desulfatitalea alkaliphila]